MALPASPLLESRTTGALRAPPAASRPTPQDGPALARSVLSVIALWAVPAAIALGQISIEQTLVGEPVAWRAALWTTLPNWVLWAALTPPVVALASRVGPSTAPAWQIVAVHAIGATLALAAHSIGNVAAFRIAGLPSDWTWGTFETHYGLRFHVNVVSYALVVAATWVVMASRRARDRERRHAALEADLANAELRALQMQVRPHFLFNALHAVGATVRKGDGDQAVTMIGQLGDLLRSSLEADGTAIVPLSRELDVLERYLALEGVRVGDRLTVDWNVESDVRQMMVPAWILQPLVENAIKHAVAAHSGPARIEVGARVLEGDLVLTVEDDGPGLGATTTSGTGVGLANTQARLATLYGDDASLDLEANADGGTTARVTLPLSR
ncbi:sensor histidine kinase [Rubrivirga sp.]|uniref:sensor histidine kinase n=1 Tax=Rubrivirga sp. TaxID=1885344 RepID=UPI003C71799D